MKRLKIYGHTDGTLKANEPPIECVEISFLTSPEVLREVGAFLIRCADRFADPSIGTDHFHLRDEWKKWLDGESADVIAVLSGPERKDG